MQITEIFDSKYTLVPAREEVSKVIKTALSQDGFSSIIVYEAKEDSNQIFMLATIDGAWEVHHTYAEPGKNFISGKILDGNRPANPKFFGTVKQLYQTKLDKAHSVRVVAFPDMWETYEKVIQYLTKNTRYEADKTKQIIRNGDTMLSQEIHPTNKFEDLKNKKVPL